MRTKTGDGVVGVRKPSLARVRGNQHADRVPVQAVIISREVTRLTIAPELARWKAGHVGTKFGPRFAPGLLCDAAPVDGRLAKFRIAFTFERARRRTCSLSGRGHWDWTGFHVFRLAC